MAEPQIWQRGSVRVVFGDKHGKFPDGNLLIVTGRDTRIVFDTPLSANIFPDQLDGTDLLINGHVHEDHVAGLHLLPGVPFYVPEADRYAVQSVEAMLSHYGYDENGTTSMRGKLVSRFHFVPRPDAIGYMDGQTWELGGSTVRAIHMPGHTRGHSVLMIEPERIAFIGDIDLTGFGPYYGDACSDLREFMATLEQIKALDADVWITYHHKGVIAESETFLRLLKRFQDKIAQREHRLLHLLHPAGATLEQLVEQRLLYPPDYHSDTAASIERKTIAEHLSVLMETGRVTHEGEIFRQR